MKYLIVSLTFLFCACGATPAEAAVPPAQVPVPKVTVVTGAPSAAERFRPRRDLERVVAELPETTLERAILDVAMDCTNAHVGKFDRALLRGLLRLEEPFGIPPQIRGMVLIAACRESGYDPLAEGDRHLVGKGSRPPAVGILQQWPWWENDRQGPRINRREPYQAATAWLAHVASRVPKVTRLCGFKPDRIDDIWRTAWVTAVRAPSKHPRCRETSRHWNGYVKWWRPKWAHLLYNGPELAAH